MEELTDSQKNLLKQAQWLMVHADEQEKSRNKTLQQEAEKTRQRLAHVLTQLHIVGQNNTDRDEQLAQLWDDWCITRKAPKTGRNCADRILFYVQQVNVYEGTMKRLALAVGAAKSTVHEALKHLVEAKKISVEKTGLEQFRMMVL